VLIVANLSRLETFVNLGFAQDPFRAVHYETGDMLRIKRILKMAVKARAMISIVGERGIGKTRAVASAIKELNAHRVIVRSLDKLRLLISDIERAMILDLGEEKPKRGGEIRARQLRRILGEASQKQKVVVVIEEAHCLHGMTLRALKTLRELDWMGKTELFTVVLLGQSDPMNKAGISEVRLRSDTVYMHGITAEEVSGYIGKTAGNVFSKEVITAVSRMPEAQNFLELQDILVVSMGRALAAGRKKVLPEDLEDLSTSDKAGQQDAVKKGNNTLQNVLNRHRPDEDSGSLQATG